MAARDNGTKLDISPAQGRAARALLGWSQDELAAFSSIPKRTIVRFEASVGVPRRSTTAAIQIALEAAGVEFISENGGGEGVRLKKEAPPDSGSAIAKAV